MENTTKKQIERALILLKSNLPAKIGDITIEIKDESISVSGLSQYYNKNHITKTIATKELKEIKEIFKEIIENSYKIRDLIENKNVIYYLLLDDGGKASITICKEENGEIKWIMDI